MKTIALFGGSFDPPHLGHCAVVDALLEMQELDEIILMPTYLNPFKDGSFAPPELRLQWLREIFAKLKRVSVSDFEVRQKRKVPSIESVEHLHKKYKKIYLIIGADNLKSLSSWHRYSELKEMVTFVVAHRDSIEIPSGYRELHVAQEISSSALRENMQESMLCEINAKKIVQYYKTKETNARQN